MSVREVEEVAPQEGEETPEYPTSNEVQHLLSSVPLIPLRLLKRLHDAHCHPTDHPETLSFIDSKASGTLSAMATRPNDQIIVEGFARDNPDLVVPFFGIHPWFAHLYKVDEEGEHHNSILKPAPSDEFISHLPELHSWENYLKDLRSRLSANPKAQVGEIGLDKSFRLPWHTNGERDPAPRRELSPYKTTQEHQIRLFADQCRIAGEFNRAISVHGVQCHGLVFTALQSLWKGHENKSKGHQKRQKKLLNDNPEEEEEDQAKSTSLPYPPRICIHSASLPIETVKQYLHSTIPSKVYFSFSTVINARYGQKLLDLISAIPEDRILIESDWHSEGSIRRSQLHDIARIVIHQKKWSIEEGIEKLEKNFFNFVNGES
jgi:Tat protein secretion system quality control protein TatD with DNase activity